MQLTAEEDVLGDGELGDQVELLVDDGDAVALGVAGAVQHERLAVEEQLAGVVGVGAAEDLHQRALAGPVLADEGMDLAAVDGRRTRRSAPERRRTTC